MMKTCPHEKTTHYTKRIMNKFTTDEGCRILWCHKCGAIKEGDRDWIEPEMFKVYKREKEMEKCRRTAHKYGYAKEESDECRKRKEFKHDCPDCPLKDPLDVLIEE